MSTHPIPKPLVWIGTVNAKRDQGLFHLVAEKPVQGIHVAVPACGARTFALTGGYPDAGAVPGQKCRRCEAIAKRHR